jgi:hypothetical protein
MFAPIQCDQLLEAAKNGHTNGVIALLAEGVDLEYKDYVRSLLFFAVMRVTVAFKSTCLEIVPMPAVFLC